MEKQRSLSPSAGNQQCQIHPQSKIFRETENLYNTEMLSIVKKMNKIEQTKKKVFEIFSVSTE